LQFFLKQQLHFSPLDMARFFIIAGIAWYLKPLAGMFSDYFPMFGSRRHSYMIAGSLSVMLLWLLIGFGPQTRPALLGAVCALTTMMAISSATVSALVVEGGRRFAATGRLSSVRRSAEYVAGMLVGPVGGFLALYSLRYSGLVCAALALILVMVIFSFRIGEDVPASRKSWAELRCTVSEMLRCRPMWAAATLFFLLSFSPGFQTPLFYYQTNTLGFSPRFIGSLTLVSASFSVIGTAAYAWLCARAGLRSLIAVAVVLDAAAQTMFVFYNSAGSALVIEATAGLMRGFVWMPILDLLVRAVPKGNEAVGAALEWSPANVAVAVSDLAGSWLYQQYGLSFRSLAWLNGGTTLLILFVVPLIPAQVMAAREGDAA
jgi:predicted MFS family arabinose efflux permease